MNPKLYTNIDVTPPYNFNKQCTPKYSPKNTLVVTDPFCPVCHGTSYDTSGPIAEECPKCK